MEVILRATKRRVKKKIKRDLYWYDPETKQQLYGHGGQIIFVYDKTRKKMTPRIVDTEDWVSENNYEDIVNWANKNNMDIVSQNENYFVTIDVSVTEWSGIESELYRNKISYDYDENDLRRETSDKSEKKIWQNSISKWQIRHQV